MILGIGHEAYVGKDTFCMLLIDYLRLKLRGLKIERQGFADKLYDTCYLLYKWAGFQHREYYIQNPAAKEVILPKLGRTPRDLLIAVGNKMREVDPEVWFRPVLLEDTKGWLKIVTDVRKTNEFDELRKQNQLLVRITRPGFESNRESDVDLLPYAGKWDLTINNNGNLDSFQKQAQIFAEEFVIPRLTAGM